MDQLCLFEVDPTPPAPPVTKSRKEPPRPVREPTAQQLKREGMDRAEWGKERLLAHAREIAHDIATGVLPKCDGELRADGLCHADDVAAAWKRENESRIARKLPPTPWLGNGAGGLFSRLPHVWELTPKRFTSRRPESHGNELKVWKLRNPSP